MENTNILKPIKEICKTDGHWWITVAGIEYCKRCSKVKHHVVKVKI